MVSEVASPDNSQMQQDPEGVSPSPDGGVSPSPDGGPQMVGFPPPQMVGSPPLCLPLPRWWGLPLPRLWEPEQGNLLGSDQVDKTLASGLAAGMPAAPHDNGAAGLLLE